jgi:hypothetical protein
LDEGGVGWVCLDGRGVHIGLPDCCQCDAGRSGFGNGLQ